MKNLFDSPFSSLAVSSWMVCHRPYSGSFDKRTDKSASNGQREHSSSTAQNSPSASKAA